MNPAAFTERSPVTVLLLSLVTCGIFFIVWKYQTSDELRQASNDESIKPGLDLVLTLCTCGLYAIWVSYRNAQKAYQLSQRMGLQRSDQSTAVLLLAIFGLALVNIFILQNEYNAIGAAGRGRALPS